MRSRDPPTAGPGPTIASRVSNSQPPLALAWQSNGLRRRRPSRESDRAAGRRQRSLSRTRRRTRRRSRAIASSPLRKSRTAAAGTEAQVSARLGRRLHVVRCASGRRVCHRVLFTVPSACEPVFVLRRNSPRLAKRPGLRGHLGRAEMHSRVGGSQRPVVGPWYEQCRLCAGGFRPGAPRGFRLGLGRAVRATALLRAA